MNKVYSIICLDKNSIYIILAVLSIFISGSISYAQKTLPEKSSLEDRREKLATLPKIKLCSDITDGIPVLLPELDNVTETDSPSGTEDSQENTPSVMAQKPSGALSADSTDHPQNNTVLEEVPDLSAYPEISDFTEPSLDGEDSSQPGTEKLVTVDLPELESSNRAESVGTASDVPLSTELPLVLPELRESEIQPPVDAETVKTEQKVVSEHENPPAENTVQASVPKKDLSETPDVKEERSLLKEVPVETASFNGITPGVTNFKEVKKILGEPFKSEEMTLDPVQPGEQAFKIMSYQFNQEGFKSVGVQILDDIVLSLTVNPEKVLSARTLARTLKIDNIQSVYLQDESGNIMGEIFPEIGVSFAYEPQDKKASSVAIPVENVIQVLFQEVSAEPFILRAQTYADMPEKGLQDIEKALKIMPGHEGALKMRAELEMKLANKSSSPSPEDKSEKIAGMALNTDIQDNSVSQNSPEVPEPMQYPTSSEMVKATTAPLPSETVIQKKMQEEKEATLSVEEILARAEILARQKNCPQALGWVEHAERTAETTLEKARIQALKGDILMITDNPSAEDALKCHTEAIKLASRVIMEQNEVNVSPEYILALDLMVDAYLGAGADIAYGNWSNKDVAVREWLQRAEHTVKQLCEVQGEDSLKSMEKAYRVALRCVAITVLVGEKMNPRPMVNTLLSTSHKILAHVQSRQEYQRICQETAQTLEDAAILCQKRADFVMAVKYLERAILMMETVIQAEKEPSNAEIFIMGRLYCRVGMIYTLVAREASAAGVAQAKPLSSGVLAGKTITQGHAEAVLWYDKAIPLLMRSISSKNLENQLLIGEIVISMSVSYWEMDQYQRTVDLLRAGIFCLEKSVERRQALADVLIIPYGNLIKVLDYLGEKNQADIYRKKLASLR